LGEILGRMGGPGAGAGAGAEAGAGAGAGELRVGDTVRVAVDQPTFGWGPVTPESVGDIISIHGATGIHRERPTARVNFPEHPSWHGLLQELVAVGAGSQPTEALLAKLLVTPAIAAAFTAVDRRAFIRGRGVGFDQPVTATGGALRQWAPSAYAAVLEALQPGAGQSVLLLGAGTGCLAALFAVLVGGDGRVHGVDLAEPAVASATSHFTAWAERAGVQTDAEFLLGDIFGLDLQRSLQYDFIVVCDALDEGNQDGGLGTRDEGAGVGAGAIEAFVSDALVYKNMWRTLLNPGGMLVVCTISGLTTVKRLPDGSFEERAIAGPPLGACPLTVPLSAPAPLVVRDRADPDFRQARGPKAAVKTPLQRLRTDDFVEAAGGAERFL
jgi:protein-L-isoaspartate O-methyltransferase